MHPSPAPRWVTVWVTSPGTHSERRFGTDTTVRLLKDKLETVTGIPASAQRLSIARTDDAASKHGDQAASLNLDDDERTMDSYRINDWMTIKVDSTDPALPSTLTDLSQVEKYEMSDKDYEARSDSLLNFKKRHKLGRFAPSSTETMSQVSAATDEHVPDNLKLGARCQVAMSDVLSRRGTVRYIGPVEFGPQDGRTWVGVEWDEPVGKNDGAVDGKRYFQTGPQKASFLRPSHVVVGDYPELDPFADEDLEM
ncbi:hypothetical protein OIV83_005697 [Microbotryomycetes sp. JL201]|nr:hypothetical protein OIV83_005697 [Microbotryomycetes sp. JL201]